VTFELDIINELPLSFLSLNLMPLQKHEKTINYKAEILFNYARVTPKVNLELKDLNFKITKEKEQEA
jgi:hypothetical protein